MSSVRAIKPAHNWEQGFDLVLNDFQKSSVIERVSVGNKIDHICADLKIPRQSFQNYLDKDPFFAKQYRVARDIYLEGHVENLFTLADDCATMMDVGAARVKSDNIKWIAAKWKPEVYGDNVNLNVNHSLDLSSVLLAAENRVLPILEAKAALRVSTNASTLPDIDVESNPTTSSLATAREEIATDDEIPDELKDLI